MKVILFTGTHSRHLFVHEHLLRNFEVCGVVMMQRETEVPTNEVKGSTNKISYWSEHDQLLYKRHFDKRKEVETAAYGELSVDDYDFGCEVLRITPEELNTEKVASFVKRKDADLCFIFGVNIIKDPVAKSLPKWKINMHLGLSPWYRGSATLFWPFYNLQPQYAGSTFHLIVDEPDAGDILHQVCPTLQRGDGIHDVGSKVVIDSARDAVHLLSALERGKIQPPQKQKSSGKNFLIRDFEPQHLRLIYDLFDDRIVDYWIDGKLGNRIPKLVKGF